MCGLSGFLRAAVMPRTIQRQGSNPKPVEIVSSPNAQESPIRGVTKFPQEMMEVMMTFLNQLIQKELSNPRRRKNMQICKDFVREYGWPEDDYCIRVLQGEVKVMTEKKCFALPASPDNVDTFLLVSSKESISASSAEIANS